MLRPIVTTLVLGISLAGAGGALLYLLLKREQDLESLTFDQSKRTRQRIEVAIPKDSVGVLIGRGGANIKDIQEKSGTRITFKDENADPTNRICVINGLPEKTQQAEAMIHEFLAAQPVLETIEVYVPQRACGRIIGRSGSTIRAMVKASGAKINLEGGSDEPDVVERRIVIRGSAAQVALAKSLIEEKVEEDGELRRSVECSSRTPRSPNHQLCINANGENITGRSTERQAVERLLAASQGGFLEVYVSALKHPGRFWIQKLGPPGIELDRLVERMTEFYNQEENRDIYKLKELVEQGDMVASKFPLDNKWYRALVHSVRVDEYDPQQSIVDVYYVDYGDDEAKPHSELCRLKIEFLPLRHQAIECALAGVDPISDEWSEESADLFEELSYAARWKPLMAKVQGYREQPRSDRSTSPVPLIDLVDSSGAQDTNLAEELIRQGFAKRLVPTPTSQNGSSPTKITKPVKRALPAGEETWGDDEDTD